jgi:hypothetical protein
MGLIKIKGKQKAAHRLTSGGRLILTTDEPSSGFRTLSAFSPYVKLSLALCLVNRNNEKRTFPRYSCSKL